MTQKTVSQMDEAGYFVGPTTADESPNEPGVFLIPGGAVDLAPPKMETGKRYRPWGTGWRGEAIPKPPAPPAPEPPGVPQMVTRFQAIAALELAGNLTAVEAIMAAPETPKMAKLAWANALHFERNSPTLAGLAAALALTDADLDQLFTVAAGIKA